jgi:Zn finger protein HypA/HybF involved in hydrogenase expression
MENTKELSTEKQCDIHVGNVDYGKQEEYKRRVKDGIIEVDGTPIKCENCGSKDYRLHTTDMIDNIEMEKEAICNKCGHLMGAWVTGNWCS